jgi:hypothetical protein
MPSRGERRHGTGVAQTVSTHDVPAPPAAGRTSDDGGAARRDARNRETFAVRSLLRRMSAGERRLTRDVDLLGTVQEQAEHEIEAAWRPPAPWAWRSDAARHPTDPRRRRVRRRPPSS